jgi:hypothetical protein
LKTDIYIIFFSIVVLTIIAYQDIKNRLVHVFLFPSIFLLGILNLVVKKNSFHDLKFNLIFLGVNFFILYLYFSFRRISISTVLNTFIGLGDFLFFISITPLFAFSEFMIFYISCQILSIGLHLTFFHRTSKYIPLAGYSAVFTIGYFLYKFLINY